MKSKHKKISKALILFICIVTLGTHLFYHAALYVNAAEVTVNVGGICGINYTQYITAGTKTVTSISNPFNASKYSKLTRTVNYNMGTSNFPWNNHYFSYTVQLISANTGNELKKLEGYYNDEGNGGYSGSNILITMDISNVDETCYVKTSITEYSQVSWDRDPADWYVVYLSDITATQKPMPTITDYSKTVSAIDGTEATFWITTSNATSYQWQIYEGNSWKNIDGAKSSIFKQAVTMSDNGKKYKCIISNAVGSVESGEITLNVKRNGYQKIMAAYYKTANAGTEINIDDVLVALLYQSGEPDFASGWSNLYFVITKDVITSTIENKDGTTSNVVETVTEESKTFKVKYGDNEITVRLKDENATETEDYTKEATFHVNGVDSQKPEFLDVKVSDYKVINEDQALEPVDIKVTLEAEDNYTEKDDLLYALKKKGKEVQDSDFTKEEIYNITVAENCVYVAYVKDTAGNINTKEIEIIIVDDKDPVIVSKSLIFKEEDGWVTRNIIQIEATDNYKPELMKYRFTLPEGIECENNASRFGEWLEEKEIVINDNGVYTIEVKDSVGNITKTTIDVKNIDGIAPEIKNIEFKALS